MTLLVVQFAGEVEGKNGAADDGRSVARRVPVEVVVLEVGAGDDVEIEGVLLRRCEELAVEERAAGAVSEEVFFGRGVLRVEDEEGVEGVGGGGTGVLAGAGLFVVGDVQLGDVVEGEGRLLVTGKDIFFNHRLEIIKFSLLIQTL